MDTVVSPPGYVVSLPLHVKAAQFEGLSPISGLGTAEFKATSVILSSLSVIVGDMNASLWMAFPWTHGVDAERGIWYDVGPGNTSKKCFWENISSLLRKSHRKKGSLSQTQCLSDMKLQMPFASSLRINLTYKGGIAQRTTEIRH